MSHTEIIYSNTDLTDRTDLYLTRRILVIAHTESTESTEIVGSAAQRTKGRCQWGKANLAKIDSKLNKFIFVGHGLLFQRFLQLRECNNMTMPKLLHLCKILISTDEDICI